MAKRRLISLLPACNQTDKLAKFFGSTVDQVFQPGTDDAVNGYVGRIPSYNDATKDFYVPEPTAERAAYQLEASMVSLDATTGTPTYALTYPDLVSYLSTSGSVVNDESRLFENDAYSWCPPIDLDKLVNYRYYYWFGDSTGSDDLPTLTVTGSGDVAAKMIGATTFALTGLVDASLGVSALSSGMRIKIVDSTTGTAGVSYMVDGVGQSIRLTPDATVVRGLAAQYVTVDRSSTDGNAWSIRNGWVHVDSFAWADTTFSARQATRPIIEFRRDIVLFNYGSNRLPDVGAILASSASSTVAGAAVGVTADNGVVLASGMLLLVASENALFSVSVSKGKIVLTPLGVTDGDYARLIVQSSFGAAGTELRYADGSWLTAQVWDESVSPEFALYDIDGVALTDSTRYPDSTFSGCTIFDYAVGTNTQDSVLLRDLEYDSNGYIVFNNSIVTDEILYKDGTISGLFQYGILTDGLVIPSSCWLACPQPTAQVLSKGFFTIPSNLEANPTSLDVTTLSRSEWVDHFSSIIGGQTGFSGIAFGANNFRDTARDGSIGTSVLQHQAPLLRTMLLAANPAFDLPASVRYAEQEYNRFRNKFSSKLVDLRRRGVVIDGDASATWVDAALRELKIDKTLASPFAGSTMAGGQYFIPPTPAFLGVLPSTVPLTTVDTVYGTQITMLVGHDGSRTAAFGDWRDGCFIELETRIYASIPATMRVTGSRPMFDIQSYLGGKFGTPTNGYARDELMAVLEPLFVRWAQNARFDYRTNTQFETGNPFTWNYRGMMDRDNQALPGNWRAIYLWYFDTMSPHLTPWEMLGFTGEPDWWTPLYGAAPYTRLNTPLWSDLEAGRIRSGERAGIASRYARPGLSAVIPVDNAGILLDPVSARIVLSAPTYNQAIRAWSAGDMGPAETLWTTSPSFRFAMAQAAFLLKPARMIETTWDSVNCSYVTKQWIDSRTNTRPALSTPLIHGETATDGTVTVVQGIQQWIVDYLIKSGGVAATLGTAVRGLDVRLMHRMAAYVASGNVTAFADNFGLIPSEDVQVMLYESPATSVESYSGVIVEKTDSGYMVIGYDTRDPSFTVIPPDLSSPKGAITYGTVIGPNVYLWASNTHYTAGVFVTYLNSTYKCLTTHLSSSVFETGFWEATPGVVPGSSKRAITYARGLSTTETVPYASAFATEQEVVDFLLGWERWLVSRGWLFDGTDNSSAPQNWSQAAQAFLTWSTMSWASGNFIALSPGANSLRFYSDTGMVLDAEDDSTGFYGLIDRSGSAIERKQVSVTRLDGDVALTAANSDIYGARIRIATIEHALILSNTTIFGDVIYLPLYNMRQVRLRMTGTCSSEWAGRLDAPGYLVSGSTLVPSFEKSVEDVRLMFDIEKSTRADLSTYTRHQVGYEERSYMSDLLLSSVEQFEFYLGMIHQKGTPGVFEKLLRSQRVNADSEIVFLEEWAYRNSRFGSPKPARATFLLDQSAIKREPQFIRFTETSTGAADWIDVPATDAAWLDLPKNPEAFFALRDPAKPLFAMTAGPVRDSEVALSVVSMSDLAAVYAAALAAATSLPFQPGDAIWVFEAASGSWDVQKVFQLGTSTVPLTVTKITTLTEDATVSGNRLYFATAHGLTVADVGSLIVVEANSQSSPNLQGVQTISDVDVADNWIEVASYGLTGFDFTAQTTTSYAAPTLGVFRSMRFATRAALAASPLGFVDGDLAYIDNDTLTPGQWSVLVLQDTIWQFARNQPSRMDPSQIISASIFDVGGRISDDKLQVNEPVLSTLSVVDPLCGLLPGAAMREIDYISDVDPAQYTTSTGSADTVDPWGDAQIGRQWWDMSTVRYLDPYTDRIGMSDARDLAELTYRSTHWAQVAPGTSVDVYEWVRSDVDPVTFATDSATDTDGTYAGTVYRADTPSFSTSATYDASLGITTTSYYFWVKNRITLPAVPFRKTANNSVIALLVNPSVDDIPWIAPLTKNSCLISGTAPYLNDTTTAVRIDLTDGLMQDAHDQWSLIRPNDEQSLPPDWLWRKLGDSLGAFDNSLAPLPSASLNAFRATGIYAGQNMFDIANTSSTRGGLLDARESFVGIANLILSRTAVITDRPAGVLTMNRSTPISDSLLWVRADDSYAIEPPPLVEYDQRVRSIARRNRLLASPAGTAAIAAGTSLRVCVDGTALPTPQWSIWTLDPAAAKTVMTDAVAAGQDPASALVSAADTVFSLAKSYDTAVDTHADMIALTGLTVGQRVYVETDETADNFWTIWRYAPAESSANAQGLVLHRVQSYRTSDFYTIVDWYASGYSASTPPMVSYGSETARDQAEGSNPSNRFVQIINSSTGSWYWCVNPLPDDLSTSTAGTTWVVVARQKGTLALSDSFYDPDAVVHGLSAASISTIAGRDGSWELRVLADAMRYGGLLTNREINEAFFSMVHFIHTQQDDVDWLFKTAFMTIAGYAVPLDQTPIQIADITSSLTDYVNEVKPYRVKIRNYAQQYSAGIDLANVHATDFDKPVHYDPVSKTYKVLSVRYGADLSILSTTLPWLDWYDQYKLDDTLVRKLKITLRFDRVTGFDDSFDGSTFSERDSFDGPDNATGTALDRILTYYQPGTGMPSLDIDALLELESKATLVDGGVDNAAPAIVYDGNGNATLALNAGSSGHPLGFGLRDPLVEANHPQERSRYLADDGLLMRITSTPLPGAPPQVCVGADVSNLTTATVVLSFREFAQSAEAVLVYRDGYRAVLGTDYSVDYLNRTVEVSLVFKTDRVSRVVVHSFGFGGYAPLVEQHFLSSAGRSTFTLDQQIVGLIVVADGVPADASQYSVSGETVTLSSTLTGEIDLGLVSFADSASFSSTINSQTLPWNSAKTWTLAMPDTDTVPQYAGTLVEVNGLRLRPPHTSSAVLTKDRRWLALDVTPSSASVLSVYVDGIAYATAIPSVSAGAAGSHTGFPLNVAVPDAVRPPTGIAGQFVLFGSILIALDVAFDGHEVIASVYQDYDYDVVGGSLIISKSIPKTARIEALTFSNAGPMATRVHTFTVAANGAYRVARPPSEDYAMVTVAGRMLTPGLDYMWSEIDFDPDAALYGITEPLPAGYLTTALVLDAGVADAYPSASLVVTVFSGRPAREGLSWIKTSTTPAPVRMAAILDDASFGSGGFGLSPFGMAGRNQIALSRFEANDRPLPVYGMDNRWEELRVQYGLKAVLTDDLADDADTFSVTVDTSLLSVAMLPALFFAEPDTATGRPGVVWINGERIEYWAMVQANDVATFSDLRRGTRGTSIGHENRVVTRATGTGAQTTFMAQGAGAVLVTLDGVGAHLNSDYTLEAGDSFSDIVFATAPANGTVVTMATTAGSAHLAGTQVDDGTTILPSDVPVGRRSADRYAAPMSQIIFG